MHTNPLGNNKRISYRIQNAYEEPWDQFASKPIYEECAVSKAYWHGTAHIYEKYEHKKHMIVQPLEYGLLETDIVVFLIRRRNPWHNSDIIIATNMNQYIELIHIDKKAVLPTFFKLDTRDRQKLYDAMREVLTK